MPTNPAPTPPSPGAPARRSFVLEPGQDAGHVAQQAAEAHLQAIWEAEEAAEEDPGNFDIDHPAVGPWDGCETCTVREILYAASPILEAHALLTASAALRTAGHHDAAALLDDQVTALQNGDPDCS